MIISEEMKKRYMADVYAELNNKGVSEEDIPRVIGKTKFIATFNTP